MNDIHLDLPRPSADRVEAAARARPDLAHAAAGIPSPDSRRGRVAELDSVRGLAALAVVVFHSNTHHLPYGWAAVDLFFVLSGYLITSIILRHGESPGFLPRFYARRGLRVWPIYYLTVLVLAAASPVLPTPTRWEYLPYCLTFTQNVPLYWAGRAPMFTWYLAQTWTLAIEEQFYLVWPALVLLIGRRRLVPVALACVAAAVLARWGGWSVMLLGTRCDGLALGALLAVWLDRSEAGGPEVRARAARQFAALAGTSLAVLAAIRWATGPSGLEPVPARPAPTILAFNTLWLGVVGFIACRAGLPGLGLLRHPLLRWLGEISYGLYLYHFVYLMLAGDIARGYGFPRLNSWWKIPTLTLCFATAWASWVYIERPILRLKNRFAYLPNPAESIRADSAAHYARSSSEGSKGRSGRAGEKMPAANGRVDLTGAGAG